MSFEEIEELVSWNLSFNISVKETLKDINRLDLLDFFLDLFNENSKSI